MDALRFSLIIIGVVIIIAIYYSGRRHIDTGDRRLQFVSGLSLSGILSRIRHLVRIPKWPVKHSVSENSEPDSQYHQNDEVAEEDIELLDRIVIDRKLDETIADDVSLILELTSDQIAPSGEQLFVPVTIMARKGQRFTGEQIIMAAESLGVSLGDDGVYRYKVADNFGYEQVLLGLANILEPGTFDRTSMQSFETPGMVLYLHLPGPLEPRAAFDRLIAIGQQMAELLEGELCDETRSVLTKQTISHLREKVEAYRFKQKMAQVKQHQK